MRIEWADAALSDLIRLYDFLAAVAPDAATRIMQNLRQAPVSLVDFPRIGEKLDLYEPREVRRIIVGDYELRYEITDDLIYILRLWHSREDRA